MAQEPWDRQDSHLDREASVVGNCHLSQSSDLRARGGGNVGVLNSALQRKGSEVKGSPLACLVRNSTDLASVCLACCNNITIHNYTFLVTLMTQYS